MTPMQQILLGVGAKKKTYMDDVFSTHLWEGTGSAQNINNRFSTQLSTHISFNHGSKKNKLFS